MIITPAWKKARNNYLFFFHFILKNMDLVLVLILGSSFCLLFNPKRAKHPYDNNNAIIIIGADFPSTDVD
jgi:hypothetical protein